MNLNFLKARVERSCLVESAGKYYGDMDSQIIQNLNNEGRNAFVGLERDDGIYTVLGEKLVYFSTKSGDTDTISITSCLNTLHNYGLNEGKGILKRYKFIPINDKQQIWIHRIKYHICTHECYIVFARLTKSLVHHKTIYFF